MKIIDGFKLRDIAGEMIVVAEGVNQTDFNKMVVLNPTATYLWRAIEGKEFELEDLTELLIKEYDVDIDLALTDSKKLLERWIELGIVK